MFCDREQPGIIGSHYCCEDFLQYEPKSCHAWLHPSASQLSRCLAHYRDCKDLSPHDTSACILVPCHLVSELSARYLLDGMQLVHTFVKGSRIYAHDMQMPLQSDAHVYFDPRRAMINTALHSASADLLTCSARLAGVPIQLLLDSGASDNFISEDFARRMGFSKRQSLSPQHLTFADGSSAF